MQKLDKKLKNRYDSLGTAFFHSVFFDFLYKLT